MKRILFIITIATCLLSCAEESWEPNEGNTNTPHYGGHTGSIPGSSNETSDNTSDQTDSEDISNENSDNSSGRTGSNSEGRTSENSNNSGNSSDRTGSDSEGTTNVNYEDNIHPNYSYDYYLNSLIIYLKVYDTPGFRTAFGMEGDRIQLPKEIVTDENTYRFVPNAGFSTLFSVENYQLNYIKRHTLLEW
ncbi:MAG: hypothetical protein K6F33_03285, partial [Bacteroidales bacterium]|nr:hypothetical protein [Bacteroidales bacterium]